MREVFSDADAFRVEFGVGPWTEKQRAVIFAAALSVDFDFFENNANRGESSGTEPDPARSGGGRIGVPLLVRAHVAPV